MVDSGWWLVYCFDGEEAALAAKTVQAESASLESALDRTVTAG